MPGSYTVTILAVVPDLLLQSLDMVFPQSIRCDSHRVLLLCPSQHSWMTYETPCPPWGPVYMVSEEMDYLSLKSLLSLRH